MSIYIHSTCIHVCIIYMYIMCSVVCVCLTVCLTVCLSVIIYTTHISRFYAEMRYVGFFFQITCGSIKPSVQKLGREIYNYANEQVFIASSENSTCLRLSTSFPAEVFLILLLLSLPQFV